MNRPILIPEEETQTIRELQDGLRTLSLENAAIPPIPSDGVYSLDTKRAVKAFQKENGLEETGEADYDTWNAVILKAEQIRNFRSKADPLAVFEPPCRVVREGDSDDIVLCIQMMLRRVLPCLPHAESIQTDGRYGGREAGLIRDIQQAAGLEQTGCVDKSTWNILSALYSRFSHPPSEQVPLFRMSPL